MLMLVVHNGSHHSDNVVRLALDMVGRDAQLKLAILCEGADVACVRAVATDTAAQIVALPGTVESGSGPTPTPARGATHWIRGAYLRARAAARSRPGVARRLFDALEFNSVACLVRQRRVQRHYAARVRAAGSVLDRLKPGVVLAWGDRHFDIELPALVAARQRGIKVLLPYVSFSSQDGLLSLRRKFDEPRRWQPFSLYRLVANLRLAGMTREDYFFVEPHVLLAARNAGGLSKDPWVIGRGLSDTVCVDSAMTFARYREAGVPAQKMRIVGACEWDLLNHLLADRTALRRRLAERYGLATEPGLVIVALPQFAEQGVMSWDEHWKEIRYVLTELVRSGRPVLVSLHPRTVPAQYAFLEKELGVRLSVEPLREILPAADVFVAANSSTLVWAVLCGIPAFMLDYYGLSSSEFSRFRSITALRDRARLAADFAAGLAVQSDFSEDWRLLSRDQVFDGGVIERYRKLVHEMAG